MTGIASSSTFSVTTHKAAFCKGFTLGAALLNIASTLVLLPFAFFSFMLFSMTPLLETRSPTHATAST
jgi:hypothetical protein